jgi:hypothetical protein
MPETSRARRWKRQRRVVQALAAASVFCAISYGWLSLFPKFKRVLNEVAVSQRRAVSLHQAKSPPSRPIYPYSVIRGGAYSAAELREALDRDPAAAEHYFGFRRSLVHTTVSPFSEPVFLSYRVGNAIYWMGRPVRLPQGETLLTDGEQYARARCGNRISPTPQTPVNDTEPAPEALNKPQPPAQNVANLDTWSEDRFLTFETPVITPSSLPVPISAVPGPMTEIPITPWWWLVTGPSGFLNVPTIAGIPPNLFPSNPTPVIQPNPIPVAPLPPAPIVTWELPVGTSPTLPGLQPVGGPTGPWPTVPEFPLYPTLPGVPTVQSVPEPALLPALILIFGGMAVAKLQRKS